MKILLLLLLIPWWCIGYYGFKYWWIKQFDFTKEDQRMCAFIGILGPVAAALAWLVHADDKVVTPKRKI